MPEKCCHRLRLEEMEALNEAIDETNRCARCYGYQKTCGDYVGLSHLLQFYELFKQDKQQPKIT